MATSTGRNPQQIQLGAGFLYIAPIDTSEPTGLSGDWPTGWVGMGYTDDGSDFTSQLTTDAVTVGEETDPVAYVSTTRESSVRFALAQITAENLKAAYNGGTVSSPTGGYVTYEPPDLGEEVRVMIGWDSAAGDERWLFRRCLNSGAITIPRRKGNNKATIPCEFRLERPAGNKSFKTWLAAATRATNG